MDEAVRQEQIDTFFQEQASQWDALTRRYEPRYDEMLQELVNRMHLPESKSAVLDLGCGTGNLSTLILRCNPNVNVICLDGASEMLDMARAKLQQFQSRVTLIQGHFSDMPSGSFNAVVSTLALHHLATDSDKRRLYSQVFKSLVPGGCFWNGDITLCSTPLDSTLDEQEWMNWLRQNDFTEQEVLTTIERSRINDRPAPLMDQLLWLRDIGFERVDCTWRYMGYAVFGGWRPQTVCE